MRVVRVLDIVLAYLLIFACAVLLVAGVFEPWCFAGAAAALVLYFIWGFFRLRCPWCRVSVDLDRLLRGAWRTCHCPNCGHEITVALYVKKGPSARKWRERPGNNDKS